MGCQGFLALWSRRGIDRFLTVRANPVSKDDGSEVALKASPDQESRSDGSADCDHQQREKKYSPGLHSLFPLGGLFAKAVGLRSTPVLAHFAVHRNGYVLVRLQIAELDHLSTGPCQLSPAAGLLRILLDGLILTPDPS